MKVNFPQMKLEFLDDETATVMGWIGPSDLLHEKHFIIALYPYNYRRGNNNIKVFAPYENFPEGTPHLYPDIEGDPSELCVEHDNFNENDSISTIIGWTIQWFVLFEDFKVTGRTW